MDIKEWCRGRSAELFERADRADRAGQEDHAVALRLAADELRYAGGFTHADLETGEKND